MYSGLITGTCTMYGECDGWVMGPMRSLVEVCATVNDDGHSLFSLCFLLDFSEYVIMTLLFFGDISAFPFIST